MPITSYYIVPFFRLVPKTSPQNISVVSLDHSTIQVTWSPPAKEHQNGIIRSYTVIVVHEESNFHQKVSVNDTSLFVPDLKPFHTYNVQIAAHTIGTGPFSSWRNVTTPQSSKCMWCA